MKWFLSWVAGGLLLLGLVPCFGGDGLRFHLHEAVLLALSNNPSLRVATLNPDVQRTYVAEQKAVFDPVLLAEPNWLKEVDQKDNAPLGVNTHKADVDVPVSLEKYFATGTRIALQGEGLVNIEGPTNSFDNVRAGVFLNQALLKGNSREANLVNLRSAEVAVQMSCYELQGFVETLVAEVEAVYWQMVVSKEKIGIVSNSLVIAEKQLAEAKERTLVGKLPPLELYAFQAEVAYREEILINERANWSSLCWLLAQLLGLPNTEEFVLDIQLSDQLPVATNITEAVATHLQCALANNAALNQARLQYDRGQLEVVKTRNGLMPQLDLFVNAGKSGYADSFGDSFSKMDGPDYDVTVGLALDYPLLRRSEKAVYQRSVLNREQYLQAFNNLRNRTIAGTHIAYIEVGRSFQQIRASAVTRSYREAAANAEKEKMNAGKSTSLLVAIAERELLDSRLTETQAQATYQQALLELYRVEGSLLARRELLLP